MPFRRICGGEQSTEYGEGSDLRRRTQIGDWLSGCDRGGARIDRGTWLTGLLREFTIMLTYLVMQMSGPRTRRIPSLTSMGFHGARERVARWQREIDILCIKYAPVLFGPLTTGERATSSSYDPDLVQAHQGKQ